MKQHNKNIHLFIFSYQLILNNLNKLALKLLNSEASILQY